ncbi:MAG: hypothetical protein HC845_13430 [Akkermansiaceae bacterium]|nr:hypothetical protein [Akkermansiaceae bacterium]
MKAPILLAAIALNCTLISQAAEPGKSQKLTSPDQVPEGLENLIGRASVRLTKPTSSAAR